MGRHFRNESIDRRMEAIRAAKKKRRVDATGHYSDAPIPEPRRRKLWRSKIPIIPVDFGSWHLYRGLADYRPPPETLLQRRREQKAHREMIENKLIAAAISEIPREVTEGQVAVLAKRAKAEVRETIRAARREFAMAAKEYVNAHKMAVAGALLEKNFETAAKASQWAIQNIQEDGERIIDRPEEAPTGSKVMVGIQLGGIPAATTVKALDPHD